MRHKYNFAFMPNLSIKRDALAARPLCQTLDRTKCDMPIFCNCKGNRI